MADREREREWGSSLAWRPRGARREAAGGSGQRPAISGPTVAHVGGSARTEQ
jgi:hypothetical protein